MSIQTEPQYTGEHILSEANGTRSRSEGTLAAGNLPAGTALAKNAGGDFVQVDTAGEAPLNKAVAILYAAADATADPVPVVVHERDCEVAASLITWPAAAKDLDIATQTANLATVGIILR